MPTVDVLYALVPDDEVEEVRRVLRRRLTEDELRSRRAPAGAYTRCDERLRDDLSAARHGGALGALAGAVVGLLVAWVVGGDGLAWLLLVAGGGAAIGGLIGGVATMQLHEVLDDDPVDTVTLRDDEPRHLLEIRSERHAIWAHRELARRPDVCFLESPEAVAARSAAAPPAEHRTG
jgi:hypothetical protein